MAPTSTFIAPTYFLSSHLQSIGRSHKLGVSWGAKSLNRVPFFTWRPVSSDILRLAGLMMWQSKYFKILLNDVAIKKIPFDSARVIRKKRNVKWSNGQFHSLLIGHGLNSK
jgi:hypothetical protein